MPTDRDKIIRQGILLSYASALGYALLTGLLFRSLPFTLLAAAISLGTAGVIHWRLLLLQQRERDRMK